jgi:photosystem II stability/assembly factor-like uncharacterized protein
MFTLVDYSDPNTIYAEYQWGNLHRSDDGGWTMNSISGDMLNDRVNWSAPLTMHPDDPSTLYFGTYRVWKSNNKGDTWLPVSPDLTAGINQYFYTITSIAISTMDPSIVVAGSGDGKLHVSADDGLTWQDRSAGLPQRWITRVATDPFQAQTIYATLSGFRWDEPLPHVFRSTDLGITWTDITANLPEFPVNDIVIDPLFMDHYLVGTDAGVYATNNGGQYWYWVWGDLPAVPIYMMKIHEPTRTIVAGTYGLSAYKADLSGIYLGVPNTAARKEGRLMVNPNPVTASAHIACYLPEKGTYCLELYDLQGRKLRTISQGKFPNGEMVVHWNPSQNNVAGNRIPTGSYLIRLEGENFTASSKVIVL